MLCLKEKISSTSVFSNNVAIWWLGQAGFVFKSDRGKVIYIDPYLSDAVERICGFKRLSFSPIKAEEVETDIVICSHEHPDHLDPDAIPLIAKNCSAKFIGPGSCVNKLRKLGIKLERIVKLEEGKTINEGDLSITGVYADHGELSPEALGVLLCFNKIKIYYCGDTAYQPERMTYIKQKKPDIIIAPINGRFGNLNGKEAILLSKYVGAKLIIPAHFWMFAEHNGDPLLFMENAKEQGVSFKLLSLGETFFYFTEE